MAVGRIAAALSSPDLMIQASLRALGLISLVLLIRTLSGSGAS